MLTPDLGLLFRLAALHFLCRECTPHLDDFSAPPSLSRGELCLYQPAGHQPSEQVQIYLPCHRMTHWYVGVFCK